MSEARIRVGRCLVDPGTRTISGPTGQGTLTATEVALLRFFVSNPDRPLSRETLYREVWGFRGAIQSRTLDTTVRNLRIRLEADPADPQHILTVHGVGYRFVAGPVVSPDTGAVSAGTTSAADGSAETAFMPTDPASTTPHSASAGPAEAGSGARASPQPAGSALEIAAPAAVPLFEGPLVGRSLEQELLRGAWQRARAGRSMLVLIEGAPGVGKTRLAESLRAEVAAAGHYHALGSAYNVGTLPALSPLRAMLRDLPRPRLPSPWQEALNRVLPPPDLEEAPADPQSGHEPWRRIQLFEALSRAVLSVQPLLLLLDDLQWWDPESLSWLQFLFQYQADARLLCLGTLRSGELGETSPLRALIGLLRRQDRLVSLPLAPLPAPACHDLVQALTGDSPSDTDTRRLLAQTEGNPLFLLEAIRAGLHRPGAGALELTPTLDALLESRISALPADARRLVELLVVAAERMEMEVLEKAAKLSAEAFLTALEALTPRDLVRETGLNEIELVHSHLGELLLQKLSPARRRLRHLQLAEGLCLMPPAAQQIEASRIGRHLLEAGQTARALPHLFHGAERARSFMAYREASSIYRRMLAVTPEERFPDENWRIRHALLELDLITGSPNIDQRELEWLEDRARTSGDPGRWTGVGILRIRHAFITGRFAEGRDLIASVRESAEALGDPLVLATVWRWNTSLARGLRAPLAEIEASFEATIRYAGQVGAHSLIFGANCSLALTYLESGQPARARAPVDRARAIASVHPGEVDEAVLISLEGNLLHEEGRFDAAIATYRRGLESARRLGMFWSEGNLHWFLSVTLNHLGRFDEAIRGLDDYIAAQEEAGRQTVADLCRDSLAHAYMYSSRLPEAIALLSGCQQRFERAGDAELRTWYTALLAEALVEAARWEEARPLLDYALTHPSASTDESALIPVAKARLALHDGQPERALEGLLDVLEVHAGKAVRAEEDRLLTAYALAVELALERARRDLPAVGGDYRELLAGLIDSFERRCTLAWYGTARPQLVPWIRYRLLSAQGDEAGAREALEAARDLVERRAALLASVEQQRAFRLEVAVNRSILEAAASVLTIPARL